MVVFFSCFTQDANKQMTAREISDFFTFSVFNLQSEYLCKNKKS